MADTRATGPGARFTRRRLLLLLAALVVIAALVAPWSNADDDRGTPSSYGTSAAGARGLYETLDRLGYTVERRLTPMRDELDPAAVYVVLEPSVPLTALEVHSLLDAVRAGAGLLAAPNRGQLADSLGVLPTTTLPSEAELSDVDAPPAPLGPGWVRRVLRAPRGEGSDSSRAYTPPVGSITFHEIGTERGTEPTVVGVPFESGRIIIAAEGSPFTNTIVRRDDGGVRALRLIEWLAAPGDRAIVFDEYHHGHGLHANVLRETRRALARTPPGRVVLQLTGAVLLLLLAVGVRPVRPRPVTRIQRRSPLEHVGALARAYSEVRATPRAAKLLVSGLMRRHHGAPTARDERAFLRALAQREPSVAGDVARLIAALDGGESEAPAELPGVVLRIEQMLAGPNAPRTGS